MHKRLFVLEPLEEIAPYLMHPLLGQTINAIKRKDKRGTVTYERFDGDKAADRSDRSEMLALFKERMGCSVEVAEYKKRNRKGKFMILFVKDRKLMP